MRDEYKFGWFFVGILLLVLFGFITWELALTIPAIWIFGMMGIILFSFIFYYIEICKRKTHHVISNKGHFSIRTKDIFHVPWHIEKEIDKKKIEYDIPMTIMNTEGIDAGGFSVEGPKEGPVLIFPSKYEERIGNEYNCLAYLEAYTIDQLDSNLKIHLDPKKQNILCGLISMVDGSATTENIELKDKLKVANSQNTALTETLDKTREQLKKQQEVSKKNLFIGEKIKSYNEEG